MRVRCSTRSTGRTSTGCGPWCSALAADAASLVDALMADFTTGALDAVYVVESLLPAASVGAFYIFFPDPWPKRRHHRRRLFSPTFLDALDRTLLPDGQVNVATDHEEYFAEISKLLKQDPRFVEVPALQPSEQERTHFEITFMQAGAPIYRCSVRKRQAEEGQGSGNK
jgi:tRNA G46 methylase TrmB